MALTLSLSVLLGQTQARLFKFQKPGTTETCAMADLEFTVEVQAVKDRKLVASKNLTSDDEGITVTGMCKSPVSQLLLKYHDHTFWYIAFQPSKDQQKPYAQYRGFQFIPTEVFGSSVSVSTQEIFYDPRPVFQDSVSDSYYCAIKDQTNYLSTKPATGDFSFRVNVTVNLIESQGINIKDDKFGPRENCKETIELE